jgi:hypothetical protein
MSFNKKLLNYIYAKTWLFPSQFVMKKAITSFLQDNVNLMICQGKKYEVSSPYDYYSGEEDIF